jgi:hypothetical protein
MNYRHMVAFAVLAGLSVAAYVGVSMPGGSAGFPLDDAWIHQTYARNLAESGQLAFVPGQASAGSTSPLWTLLIAAGYKLNVEYRLWTYALGALSLALCAWTAARLSLRLWPDRPHLALAAGLLCLFEWHLVWAAASGMETVLFAGLGLALIERAARPISGWRGGAVFGALGGLMIVTRPEGLLLVAMAGLVAVTRPAHPDRSGAPDTAESVFHLRLAFVVASAAGFVIPVLPAVWLNVLASGTLFPNTFYAKQQEYVVYFSSFAVWLPRAIEVIGAPFIGAQILLVPGLLRRVFSSLFNLRDRSAWPCALPAAWFAAHLAAYVARLPVAYQHGRYLIPMIPIVVLVGLHGSARLLERIRWRRVMHRASLASLVAATAAFWLLGAGAYRIDVDVIENELVASARWIDANTASDALVAAHDIGAMGYFAQRPLLDLAGLISPEVIPIIRDEPALMEMLRARRPDFLAVPPDFYSTLLDAPGLEPVFTGSSPAAPRHWQVFRTGWR